MSKYKIIEETKQNGDVRYHVLKRRWFMWFIKSRSQFSPPFFDLYLAKAYIEELIDKEKKGVVKKVVYTTGYGVPKMPYAPLPPKKYKRRMWTISDQCKNRIKLFSDITWE